MPRNNKSCLRRQDEALVGDVKGKTAALLVNLFNSSTIINASSICN